METRWALGGVACLFVCIFSLIIIILTMWFL
jgi:hypothetical protein